MTTFRYTDTRDGRVFEVIAANAATARLKFAQVKLPAARANAAKKGKDVNTIEAAVRPEGYYIEAVCKPGALAPTPTGSRVSIVCKFFTPTRRIEFAAGSVDADRRTLDRDTRDALMGVEARD